MGNGSRVGRGTAARWLANVALVCVVARVHRASAQSEQTPPPEEPRRPPTAARSTADTRNTAAIIQNYPDQIDVPAGQSAIVRLSRPAERVAIADPEVADVVLVEPTEILINGRGRRHTAASGETIVQEAQTSLVVWDKQGRTDVRAVFVNRSRTEQIELRVTVAELDRTALENQGFDFRIFQNKIAFIGNPSKLAPFTNANLNFTSPVPGGPVTFNDTSTPNSDRVAFALIDFNDNFAAFLELLQREAMAKILARPTVIARSGEEAHFRAGGEVPIPLVTNNQIAVQFKEFGAIVHFVPTFTPDGTIDLRVTAELSQPDTTISQVQVGGFVVPGFRSDQASTRVRLRDGQGLLMAGLIRDDQNEDERKVPYLGDVPYLGALFRTTSFTHTKTELMILVRPHVVSADRDDSDLQLPITRGPLTRSEVRTKPDPHEVSRPRLFGTPPKENQNDVGGH